MGRFVHDETLSDLSTITASCNITTAQASQNNPCIATVTIEASTLQQILTLANLYLYDNPFRPDVVDENTTMRDVVEQNNQEGQDRHDLLRDTIEVLSGRLSVAASPDYGKSNDDSVVLTRQTRRYMNELNTKLVNQF
jgi:hypothetical protein